LAKNIYTSIKRSNLSLLILLLDILSFLSCQQTSLTTKNRNTSSHYLFIKQLAVQVFYSTKFRPIYKSHTQEATEDLAGLMTSVTGVTKKKKRAGGTFYHGRVSEGRDFRCGTRKTLVPENSERRRRIIS